MSSKEDEETDKPQLMFRTPYRLMVEAPSNLSGGASYSLDQCACELHPKTMSELAADPTSKLFDGDFVVIKGKTQSKIVVRVYKNANCEEGAVYVNDEFDITKTRKIHPREAAMNKRRAADDYADEDLGANPIMTSGPQPRCHTACGQ